MIEVYSVFKIFINEIQTKFLAKVKNIILFYIIKYNYPNYFIVFIDVIEINFYLLI